MISPLILAISFALPLFSGAPHEANVPSNYFAGNIGAAAIAVEQAMPNGKSIPEAFTRQIPADGENVAFFKTTSPLIWRGALFLPEGTLLYTKRTSSHMRLFKILLVKTDRDSPWSPCYGAVDRDRAYVSTLVLPKSSKFPADASLFYILPTQESEKAVVRKK